MASLRKDGLDQEVPPKMTQRMHLPTPGSAARFPVCRCKHAMQQARHLSTKLCSCSLTLLISILIFTGFCLQHIRLELQLVHTLMFGKGICEPVPKAPPSPHPPGGTMQKSGSSSRQQGESRKSKVKPLLTGQIAEAEKHVPGYYVTASLVFLPPIPHLATCAHLINVLLIISC